MPARVILACAVLFGAVCAPAAWAGPWARDAGKAFVSVAREQDRAGNAHTGLYAEYGLTRRRTLGFEVGHTDKGETVAMLWYQRSLDKETGANRLAWSTGLGAVRRNGQVMPSSQVALMWGRGFQNPWDGGWLTVEGRVIVSGRFETMRARDGRTVSGLAAVAPDAVAKLDLTVGLRPTPAWSFVNQLRLEAARERDVTARLAASVVRDLPGPARIEAGVIAPLTGPAEPALKIGTWLEF